LSLAVTLGLAGASSASTVSGVYDFTGTQYTDDFTQLRRGRQITAAGGDVGGTGQPALNFTGQAGPAGDTWLTTWTPAGSPAVLNGRCGISVGATVLTHPFNNRKGVGLVTLLNDANPGDKGLAVILYDNGNSDALQLAAMDPSTGKLTSLGVLPLGARIKEDAWYFLELDVRVELGFDGDELVGEIDLISFTDPRDPSSDFDQTVTVPFRGPLSVTGLQMQGQVGIIASAVGAVVDSSVSNWFAAQGFEGPCSD
jgi:hypothetical protein